MDGTIALRERERKRILALYRSSRSPVVCRRAQIILLPSSGLSWSMIARVMFCSTRTVDRWKKRYESGGIAALTIERRGRRARFADWLMKLVAQWVLSKAPRDFGLLRSRWCCATIVLVAAERFDVRVSRETVRRWLHRENVMYRRPRPIVGPTDPLRASKLEKLRELLANLPNDEVAVFQDEVDINLNPKIGSMWMMKGVQAPVETPGNNEKRYPAGSLSRLTGDVIMTEGLKGEGRSSALFVRHLGELRRRYRCYQRLRVGSILRTPSTIAILPKRERGITPTATFADSTTDSTIKPHSRSASMVAGCVSASSTVTVTPRASVRSPSTVPPAMSASSAGSTHFASRSDRAAAASSDFLAAVITD